MKTMIWAKIKLVMTFLAGAALLMAGGERASAAESASPAAPAAPAPGKIERQGPLAGLPSAPGAHLEKIKALGDNQWVDLGSPAPDPKWGKAGGRSWGTQALVLAPELRGAFLFGEGLHAYVKPNGYADDDLWFYDINAHRWICLYPGMNPKTFVQRIKDQDLKIDDLGRMVDRDGQPIPVHTHIHAWGSLAYDSDQKKLLLGGGPDIGTYYLPGVDDMKPGLALLAEQRKGKKAPPAWSGFLYDTLTGRFELHPATGSYGIAGNEFPKTVYVPGSKQFFTVGVLGVATFDPAKRNISLVDAKGPRPEGYDLSGCYDSKRNRVYLGTAHAYDIDSRTWIKLDATGTRPTAYSTLRLSLQYDPLNDALVAIQFMPANGEKDSKAVGVYGYSPEANSWSGPSPLPAFRKPMANVCYDRELNAWFCHLAGDSEANGSMWAYRYKKAA